MQVAEFFPWQGSAASIIATILRPETHIRKWFLRKGRRRRDRLPPIQLSTAFRLPRSAIQKCFYYQGESLIGSTRHKRTRSKCLKSRIKPISAADSILAKHSASLMNERTLEGTQRSTQLWFGGPDSISFSASSKITKWSRWGYPESSSRHQSLAWTAMVGPPAELWHGFYADRPLEADPLSSCRPSAQLKARLFPIAPESRANRKLFTWT